MTTIKIDDADPSLQYSPTGGWFQSVSSNEYKGYVVGYTCDLVNLLTRRASTTHGSGTNGATVTFTFHGNDLIPWQT